MTKHLLRDLDRLNRLVLTMAGTVEEAIYRSTTALQTCDPDLAAAVIEADDRIDDLENEVQEECMKLLALHAPVATDLRRVTAAMSLATDLERMGDLAVGIADRVGDLRCHPSRTSVPSRVADMTRRSTEMVRRALDAYANRDATAARTVIRMDDEVDRDNDAIIQELIEGMKADPVNLEAGLSLFSAVRHIERIADHATNIAEGVVYAVEGEVLRHHPEAIEAR